MRAQEVRPSAGFWGMATLIMFQVVLVLQVLNHIDNDIKRLRPAPTASPSPLVQPSEQPRPSSTALGPLAGPTTPPPSPQALRTPHRASRSRAYGLNWYALRQCESGGDYTQVSSSGKFRGAYQFSRSTWATVGSPGDPAAASPAEQDARAQRLYDRDGRSPWPYCGRFL